MGRVPREETPPDDGTSDACTEGRVTTGSAALIGHCGHQGGQRCLIA